MEICDDICETKPVECQRFVIHGQDFICEFYFDIVMVMCTQLLRSVNIVMEINGNYWKLLEINGN